MRVTLGLLFGFAGLCSLVALSGAADRPKAGTTHVVKMGGGTNTFDPLDPPNVKVGDSVKWVNGGGTHTATSDDIKTGDPKKTFNTGTVKKGQEVTIYFNEEGTYKYHCEYHAGMIGSITVSR